MRKDRVLDGNGIQIEGKLKILISISGDFFILIINCPFFVLQPFLGGGEFTNAVSGKIRLGKETLMTIDGHWDDTVMIKDKKNGNKDEILMKVTPEVRQSRLKRYTVPMSDQGQFESARLWQNVSKAIENDDQLAATEEKSILEEQQRAGARERKATGAEWQPKFFELVRKRYL